MKKIFPVSLALCALALPALVLAAESCVTGTGGFVPLACADNSSIAQAYQAQNLAGYAQALFNIALSVGAMAAVLRLVYAGYLYMGDDIWSNKGKAKEVIGDVVFGLLILLGVYLILYQINPDILKLNVLRGVSSSTSAEPKSPVSPTKTQPQPTPSPFTDPEGNPISP